MTLIEGKGRSHKVCGNCRTTIVLPDTLTDDEKAHLAELCRTDRRMEASQHLHLKHLSELREAKAVAFHVTGTKGQCHRCKTVLAGQDVCPKCRSLNLDW